MAMQVCNAFSQVMYGRQGFEEECCTEVRLLYGTVDSCAR